jgi:hypothetical protein
MFWFPHSPYSAIWSESFCRSLSRYSAFLCVVDALFIIWFSCVRPHFNSNPQVKLFDHFEIRNFFFHLLGNFIDSVWFFIWTRNIQSGIAGDLKFLAICVLIAIFIARGFLLCSSSVMCNYKEPDEEIGSSEIVSEDDLNEGYSKAPWWLSCWFFIWSFLFLVGSWSIYAVLAGGALAYFLVFGMLNCWIWLIFSD